MSNGNDSQWLPPLPDRSPTTPPLPGRDPNPETAQIPSVEVHPVGDDVGDDSIYAEEQELDTDDEYEEPDEEQSSEDTGIRRPWWKRRLPHDTARFRRARHGNTATASWCVKVSNYRWYLRWRKRHIPHTITMTYSTATGWVHPWLINKLHFKPLEGMNGSEGETKLLYVQRLHWIQPRTAIPQVVGALAWIIGLTVWFMTIGGSGIVSKTVILIVWLIGWFVYFMSGWLPWAYTFVVVTNVRVIYDTWLPFRIPPKPIRNNLPIRNTINTTIGAPTWLANILGYNTLEFETAGSNKATRLFEEGIKYVKNVDAIEQCTGAVRSR